MQQNFSKADRALLIRLEERVVYLQEQIKELSERFNDLQIENKKDYVSSLEFKPIQRAIYAVIGLIISGFVGTLFAIILKTSGG
jgi:hypothetical protein